VAFGVDAGEGDAVASVLDAMKGEVFVQVRARGELVVPPEAVKVADLRTRLASVRCERMIVTGEAGDAVGDAQLPFAVVRRKDPPHDAPRATSVGRIAMTCPPGDADAIEPLYVRAPDITKPK
jgi:tRNA A37 threonylcarbamoyladenosine modification protein TsaB